MPPLLFTGLFVGLWCWKCAMMVLFQNTIIYNPFLPPNARSMTINEVSRDCGRLKWREERIRSLDGTEIALCVADVPSVPEPSPAKTKPPIYVLYFQGWPISLIVKCIVATTQIARSFLDNASSSRERAVNPLHHARLHESKSDKGDGEKPTVLLWGQSIGCGFATNLAAKGEFPRDLTIGGLILETPFTNVRAMLQALYPQTWLPYQYLWPFLRNHLDSWANLGMIAKRFPETPPGIFIVEAGKDELVPANHAEELFQQCQRVGLPVERHKVRGALHNEAMVRVAGKQALAHSIVTAVTQARRHERLYRVEVLGELCQVPYLGAPC
ncbi:hypothetical protein FPSE_05022 [Fusarium pseudograminearum CS3096]|uniref:Peptidase S9 prolyl oligopeptidase catalytic domain-containing protein n=1 Tax=Fusarium pseudograminearum (strain CS3096) TaxID=1028729 RepID=K3VMI4_FUSPC|nr:hypothetical protein FPSE_05022 [Fusarium pseudograminearum CS3096]EKJ74848.1 hypothetical protein FPSE_05022 [Fusarium pseudograminearum CS3096]